MNTPLITIGLTTYNAQDTIQDALDSALSQNWPDFQIIIIDDYSTDKTWDMLNEAKDHNPDIYLFQNVKNMGVAVSRNRIIEEATGEFIAFFDDDDVSMPNRIEQQYQRIIQYEKEFANGHDVICHSARLQIYPDGQSHIEETMGMNEGSIAPNGQAVAERILTGKPFKHGYGSTATCSQMARISTYRKLNGFDSEFYRSEDTDFNIRLAIKGGHFLGVADPLVTQKMTMSDDKNLQSEKLFTLQLLKKHKNFIQSIGSYNACYKWIEAKYEYLSGAKYSFFKSIVELFLCHPIFVLQRIIWAIPNIGLNKRFSKFYAQR